MGSNVFHEIATLWNLNYFHHVEISERPKQPKLVSATTFRSYTTRNEQKFRQINFFYMVFRIVVVKNEWL